MISVTLFFGRFDMRMMQVLFLHLLSFFFFFFVKNSSSIVKYEHKPSVFFFHNEWWLQSEVSYLLFPFSKSYGF